MLKLAMCNLLFPRRDRIRPPTYELFSGKVNVRGHQTLLQAFKPSHALTGDMKACQAEHKHKISVSKDAD